MDAQQIIAQLNLLCSDLDEGRALRRVVLGRTLAQLVIPAALGLSSALVAGCGVHQAYSVPPYATPFEVAEVCDDRVDNDVDGLIDCDDSECRDGESCVGYSLPLPAYARPFEPQRPAEVCGDGRDNDGDGRADCGDPDCFESDLCGAVAEYAVPFAPPELCDDQRDNDGDGLIDCGDPDCGCAVALYAAPPPCADGDGDGQPDCLELPDPGEMQPLYGVPSPR